MLNEADILAGKALHENASRKLSAVRENIKNAEGACLAMLNRYQTFNRADGHADKLPPDIGEAQRWNAKPGNLYSRPAKMHLDPAKDELIRIVIDQENMTEGSHNSTR